MFLFRGRAITRSQMVDAATRRPGGKSTVIADRDASDLNPVGDIEERVERDELLSGRSPSADTPKDAVNPEARECSHPDDRENSGV